MIFKLLENYIPKLPTKVLKRGEIFYNEGDTPSNIYIVIDGLMGLFHIAESGKETFLRVFGEKQIFGHRSYIAKTPYHATSMALTKVKVAIISKDTWEEILSNSPVVISEIARELACDLGRAELRLSGLIDKSATSRIIESLIYLKLKYPNQVWTRKEVAEFSGSTFETVARVMKTLDEKSLIKKDGRDFIITDQNGLLELSRSNI